MGGEYAPCAECRWVGRLRGDGTVRRHRERADAGRPGSTGSLPQDPGAPVCEGSGRPPGDV